MHVGGECWRRWPWAVGILNLICLLLPVRVSCKNLKPSHQHQDSDHLDFYSMKLCKGPCKGGTIGDTLKGRFQPKGEYP